MADRLLAARGAGQVGVHWPRNFVKRTDSLTTRFNRPYDRQRALCEDPAIIRPWFELVERTKAKYGICDEDVYNFDEASFMIGKIMAQLVVTGSERRGRPKAIQPGNREWVTTIAAISAAGWAIPPFIIFAGQHYLSAWYEEAEIPRDWVIVISDNGWTTNELGVAWLRHFNAHTEKRVVGARRLLILDGHESHNSLEFQELCKENNIYTLCMPAHSSHLLQPLDVGCFSPLKRAYSREVEHLMRHHINHITKLEFLPAFKTAYEQTFTPSNICSAFRGAGLVPLQPDVVISKLDVQLRTPSNVRELTAQSSLTSDRVRKHKSSSPVSMIEAINQLRKGAEVIMLSAELMRDRIASLERANASVSARRSRKKKRLQRQGVLTKGAGEDLLAQRRAGEQAARGERQREGQPGLSRQALARCTRCRETGHNSRTCKKETLDIA
jgi:hypothetical protein